MFIHTYKLGPVEAFWEAVLPICTSTSECQEITDPAYYFAKWCFSRISSNMPNAGNVDGSRRKPLASAVCQ